MMKNTSAVDANVDARDSRFEPIAVSKTRLFLTDSFMWLYIGAGVITCGIALKFAIDKFLVWA